MRIFAIGDIHGCIETLQALMENIRPMAKDKIIFLGDYIDRGPDPKKVLDYLIDLQKQGKDIITLKGNHEYMFLQSQYGKNELLAWMYNGAKYTLDSFAVTSVNEIDSQYFEFIENMPCYYVYDNFYFVHAGFNEDLIFTDTKAMVWIRKEKYKSDFFRNKVIIHGHTPHKLEDLKQELTNPAGVINLDTGCVYATETGFGYLTAYELFSKEIYYMRNIDRI